MSPSKSSVHAVSKSHATPSAHADAVLKRAERAKEEVLRMQEDLALAPALSSVVRKHLAAWTRLPLAAFTQVLVLHAEYGAKIGDVDVAGIERAIAYEQALAPLLAAVKELARRLEDALITSRASVGKQPMGVAMTLRAAVRYGADSQVQHDLDALEALIGRKRPTKKAKKGAGASPPGNGV